MKRTKAEPTWAERVQWNSNTYGSALRIKKSWIMSIFIFLCIMTPATNWMIPIAGKIIKSGITLRYGQ